MALFGSGKDSETQASVPGQPETPVQEVINMKSQGLTNNQIIQNLQREGFKSHQIFDAMNQADLRLSQSSGAPQQPQQMSGQQQPQSNPSNPAQMSPYYQNEQAQPWPGQEGNQQQQPAAQPPASEPDPLLSPPGKGQMPQPRQTPAQPAPGQQPMPGQPQQGLPPQQMQQQASPGLMGPGEQDEVDRIEEVAEAIIDEKWSELMKHIQKVIDWKQRVDQRILEMENKFTHLQEEFDKLHEGLLGKIEEYDSNIKDVGTEIKGMEKVFQKIIPELTDNVAELSKLTDDFKEDSKSKKKKKSKK